MDATLVYMGYRGEDASRTRADSRRPKPWQSSSDTGPGASASWDDGSRGYGEDNGYANAGGQGGYAPDDSYSGYEDYGQGGAYATPGGYAGGGGYGDTGGYGQSGGYGITGGYADSTGYAGGQDYADGGYGPGYGQSGGYGHQGGYDSGYGDSYTGSPITGSYNTPGRHSGGFRADAGNDWYSGQPAAASGSGFADTGVHNFGGQALDAYGAGYDDGYQGGDGYPGNSLAVRDPVRGFPPAPGRSPAQLESGPGHGLARTGQQERYDDRQYDAYQGYGGRDDYGSRDDYGDYNDYNEAQAFQASGYETGRGYDTGPGQSLGRGYDDYDEETPYQERYGGDDRPRRSGRSRGRNKPRGRRGKRALISVLAVVVVGVLGVAGYTYVHKQKPHAGTSADATGPLPTSGTSASAATSACVKQFGDYCHIELRTDDPAPLTIAELFPPAFLNEADKTSFTRIGSKLDTTCSNAVIGQDLINALKADKCTQVLRASYVSGDNTIMGTIGVVNLATTNEAHHAGKVVGANDFITPLSTKTGIGSKLGSGTGVVEAEFKGHYLFLTWAEYTNGKAPSTKAQDLQLEQFEADLVAGSANIYLSERMINGSAQTTPSPGATPSTSTSAKASATSTASG